MRVCLMIEGQEGVSWDQWTALAETAEASGFDAMFRSDHYLPIMHGGEALDATDAWTLIGGLAAVTSTLRLGTLVSPVTFRHPSLLARAVATADMISGGRVELGIGAGWYDAEHRAHGFPFPDVGERYERLTEQLEIIHRSWTEDDVTVEGQHYTVRDLSARPRPVSDPHPPLIMGGEAGPKASALAARWADEYNVIGASVDELADRRDRLHAACQEIDRDPDTLRLSTMTPVFVGRTRDEARERAGRIVSGMKPDADLDAFLAERDDKWTFGSVEDVIQRLRRLEDIGLERVMFQLLDHTDLDAIELIGRDVIPAVR